MSGVTLLDRNDIKQAASSSLVTPYALDIGYATFLNLFPDEGRFHHALGNGVIRRRTAGSRASEDWIIAVVDVLDANNGLRPAGTRVITRPFTERTFRLAIIRVHKPFDDDFSLSREGQAGGLTLDDFNGRSFQTTSVIEFRNAVVDLVTRDHEKDRILTDADNDRAGLTFLEVFRPLDGSMFPRGDVATHALFVLHHAAVGAEVDPSLFRISGDDETCGADKASAVQFVN